MSARFYYNLELEEALRNLFGERYYGKASGFFQPKTVQKAMLQAIKKIRKTIRKMKADPRFHERANAELDILEHELNQLTVGNNDWKIVAHLLGLISTLLGYDWNEGKQFRKPKYYQTPTQKRMSLAKP